MRTLLTCSTWPAVFAAIALPGCTVESPNSEPPTTSSEALGSATSASHERHERTPVIFDGDMDFDDVSSLAFLCEEHKQGRIDLRAVTVEDAGVGIPGEAIRHARCVLQKCGLSNIPVADGSPIAPNVPSPLLRGAIEAIIEGAMPDCTASPAPSSIGAPELLAEAVRDAHGDAVVIATGPLGNVSAALDVSPTHGHCDHGFQHNDVARSIKRLYALSGALKVPGDVGPLIATGFDGSQETNAWIDPGATADVFASLPPYTVFMVPIDATNYVPITEAYVARIGAERATPEADLVYSIVSQPITQFGISQGLFYWWDPLDTVIATRNEDISSFDKVRVSVVLDGPSAGRTVLDDHGAKVRATFAANQSNFEDAFLAGLNGTPADGDDDD